MVVLDATIVNIALPSAQRALDFSTDSRQWVITAYALAFGSLLLLGGKLGDLFGRKWTFIAGLIGFSGASAVGGLAQSFGMLIAARGLQGAFGALLAPSALSLLTVTFADSPDRATAFGIFGAIAGGGASVGLLLGGLLTEVLSWRWCLYVNVAIAIPTAFTAVEAVAQCGSSGAPAHRHCPACSSASGGLFALVYGFSSAETSSWSDPGHDLFSGRECHYCSVSFVLVESRASHPCSPAHRLGPGPWRGYASIALAGSGVFGVFLFLTYYMQEGLGFSPLKTGVAFMPLTIAIVITSTTVQTQLVHRHRSQAARGGRDDAWSARDVSFTRLPRRQLRRLMCCQA